MLQIIMKSRMPLFALTTVAIAFWLMAPLARAHERDTYKIGNNLYLITIGSLNEPFVVDKMSGVDLRVSEVGANSGGTSKTAAKGAPVTGLEQTLKVELSAGDKKKTLSFDPSREAPGAYSATFIPTVQTTYSYRIFGAINGSAVDLTFSCIPGEASESAEDNSQVKVSDGVTRLHKVGGFGCPEAKSSLGFPEPAASSYELAQSNQSVEAEARRASLQASAAKALGVAALIAGILGIAVAGMAWRKKKGSQAS
jgi:hypothetical protein